MLDTQVLRDMYEETMVSWMVAYSEILLGGYTVCDICHQHSGDGKYYSVMSSEEVELLVCKECLDGYLTSVWREA